MFIDTHITIAKNVIDNLKTNKNIKLNERIFLYGNISPDLNLDFIKKPHYKELCYEEIRKQMREISNTRMTMKEFSYKAGIICHYISDMFSYPHEQNWRFFKGSTIEHLTYETKQGIKTKEKNFLIDKSIALNDLELESIDFFIENLLFEYQKIVDYENDIKFSLIASYRYVEASLVRMFADNIIIV